MKRAQSIIAALTAALLGTGLAAPVLNAQTEPDPDQQPSQVIRDGSSAAQAAASCWAIKQENPEAEDGTYWLLSPEMKSPQEFFCDQTMDGGGWVMIGRGRETWDRYAVGHGDPASLAQRERTPADFEAVQLPESTVNELMAGRAINAADQGFRVVRATNVQGTEFQTVDIRPDRMTDWTWALGTEETGIFRVGTSRWYGTGSMTTAFGLDHGLGYVNLAMQTNRGYRMGFGYGTAVAGNSDASSFLWSDTGTAPLPYSEVYLRPRIANDDPAFERIADEGTAAVENPALASNFAAPTSWGVTGNLTGRRQEGNAPVQAFAQIGDTIFVGGNFTHAATDNGATKVPRTAIAAFDKNTGELRQEFSLTLNNQVKALLALPNGKLVVAGDFTTVNGEPRVGTVMVDPITGAVDPSWSLEIVNRLTGASVSVRSLALSDNHIYLGGAFTHLQDAHRSWVYARSAARVSLEGTPDREWNPEFNGTVMDVDVSPDNDRFYAAGYFTKSVDNEQNKAAALSTEPGAQLAVPGWRFTPSNSDRSGYQQAVSDDGGLVFFGGSEHSLYGFDRSSLERKAGSITKSNGGDFQAVTGNESVTYAGCHCADFAYQDAYTWAGLNKDWTAVDNIQWFGAWDSQTGKQLDAFNPYKLESNNAGAWALFLDSDGALWAGGDFIGSRTSMTTKQWNGGFVKYPLRDHDAPGTPASAEIDAVTQEGVVLSWDALTEEAVRYEVLRDDRVIATTTSTRITVPLGGENRFFIRAVDEAGNRSASTTVLLADEPSDRSLASATLIPSGAEWFYSYNQGTPSDGWNAPDADHSYWKQASAPLGYGGADLATVITPPAAAERPVSTYFAHSFFVAHPQSFSEARLSFIADDGAVVYLNGREVHRVRMPEGQISAGTYATGAVSAATAAANKVEVTIPSHLLRAGDNVIGVETHLNYRSSPSMTFDAALVVSNFDDAPPPPPEPTTLVGEEEIWSFHPGTQEPQEGWNVDKGFLATPTQPHEELTVRTPVGWGHANLLTVVQSDPAHRPISYYFTKDFEFDPNSAPTADAAHLTLTVRADDGAVVYLNGEEVGRKRMPEGQLTYTTYASTAVNSELGVNDLLIIELPLAKLKAGTNRLAVSTHANYRNTPSLSFEATAVVNPS